MLILEILIAGDEVVRRWSRGCQLQKRTIFFVANWCNACAETYQLCHLPQHGQELESGNAGTPEVTLKFGAMKNILELGECRRAHDRNNFAP